MLADHADFVIGVDTHRDSHAAAVIAALSGAVQAHTTIAPTRSASSDCCEARISLPPSAGPRATPRPFGCEARVRRILPKGLLVPRRSA